MEKVLKSRVPLMLNSGELSINKVYKNRRDGKGKVLSAEGGAWKTRTTYQLMQQIGPVAANYPQNQPYCLELLFRIKVFNKGYPDKATNRFKSIDAGNLGKLVQDCVKDATGVDDAAHFDLIQKKRHWEGEPFVDITLWRMEEDEILE